MHKGVVAEKTKESAEDSHSPAGTGFVPGQITITRDDQSNEWVVELGPGLDLLEVIQVLNKVQHQAIELMQEQVVNASLPNSNNVDQSLRDTVTF